MPSWTKPYTKEVIDKAHAELVRHREKADIPRIQLLRAVKSSGDKTLFASHIPAVREKALENLSFLMKKHAAKLENNKPYFGILCGVAVHMAKRQLGLILSSKEAFYKGRLKEKRMSELRTILGLQPHSSQREKVIHHA